MSVVNKFANSDRDSHYAMLKYAKFKSSEKSKLQAKQVTSLACVRPMLTNASALLRKRVETVKAKQDFEKKYVLVNGDSKDSSPLTPYDDSIKLIDTQVKTMKTEMGMMFGNKELKISLPIPNWTLNTTITTGLINTVTNITPVSSLDWSAVIALFDEFQVESFVYEFTMPSVSPQLPTALMSSNSLILCYAPADNTPFAGASAEATAVQYDKHQWYAASQGSGTGAVTTMPYGSTLKFSHKIPHGILTSFSSGTTPQAIGEGNWQATNSATILPYGYLKPYSTAGSTASSVAAVTGVMYFHCKFRCRI
jgi:hypothetical protein